jgi:hypothetical protein
MKKSLIIPGLALCLCMIAQAQGPVVTTDKPDYAPGETAHFTASGFQSLELLDFSIAVSDDNGLWLPDIAWADIPADSSGGGNVDYVVPETWANKTLQLTVMGLTSGLMAQTTFTDVVTNINFATSGLPASTSVSVPWNGTNNGGNPISGTATFSSPGPSSPVIGARQTTQFFFTFPASIVVGTDTYDLVSTSQTSGFTIPSGGPPTPNISIIGTYQKRVPLNNPPVITCLNNDAELGQVVGCLGVGTGFGQTFSVSYGFVAAPSPAPANEKIVQATFTKPDSSTVTVDVATVTDQDGDTIAVTLSSGTNPVTISGPGSGSAPFSVHIHADDGTGTTNATADSTCGGDANAQIIYNFNGFFPPLDNNSSTLVKRGSTVPVKFQVSDGCGNQVTTGNFAIDVVWLSGVVPAGNPEVTDAGSSNDNGDLFRYDPVGMQWIYNLQTKVGYIVSDTYQISADLGDGVDHNVSISIKK